MIKPRLFVFGDSWSTNYFSKSNPLLPHIRPFLGSRTVENFVKRYDYYGHWIDHMSNFFDVYSYGIGAASVDQIILQIGNLKKYEYRDGDRIVIIFSGPDRFNWIFNNKKYGVTPGGIVTEKYFNNDVVATRILKEQLIKRNVWWETESIEKDEKNFIEFIPTILMKWEPVMITWHRDLNIDVVEYIGNGYPKIVQETKGKYVDGHLGVFGNFKLFQLISNKLGLDVSDYNPIIEEFTINRDLI